MFYHTVRLDSRLGEGVDDSRGQKGSLQSPEHSQDLLTLFQVAWSVINPADIGSHGKTERIIGVPIVFI
jgi:hypothetical protein